MESYFSVKAATARLAAVAALVMSGAVITARAGTVAPMRPHLVESYGKLPLSFEANQGQTDARVKFLSRGSGYTLFLTQEGATLALHGKKENAALRMRLLGANRHAAVTGADGLPGKSNYFIGNDPKQWQTNVPTYGAVKYSGVYPGIDLVYHGNQRLLEYDFVVAPGADPSKIDLRFDGAQKLSVNANGELVIAMGGDEVIEHAPVAYQEIGGERKTLSGRYVLRGGGRVGFSVADYDRGQPLVIDPTLVYSTYLGAVYVDQRPAIAVDGQGNAYVTGTTDDPKFPTTVGAFQTNLFEVGAFVAKLEADGSTLIYSTFLGGFSYSTGIAVDAWGNAYITGIASGLPTTSGAFQNTYGGGSGDAFVIKLNATGSGLIYSTYLGGSSSEEGMSIAIDNSGNAYITGTTYSSDFPTTPGAFQTYLNSTQGGAFVAKLNAAGSALVYSTFLSGGSGAGGAAIAVDAHGNAYVTGSTTSSDFPTTVGAFQTTFGGGGVDAFVSKLNATGSALVYSTYLGGHANGTWGSAVAVDASGNVFLTGETYASDFPITPGAFQIVASGVQDAFVTKLNTAGSALVYSTFLTGSSGAMGNGIVVDASNNVYVTGSTGSSDFPTTVGAFQTTFAGAGDAFVSKLNAAGSALLYSTYLGGSSTDNGQSIAIDGSSNAYVTGTTGSSDFPFSPDAFSTTFGGPEPYMTFVTKLSTEISVVLGPVTTASFSGPLGLGGWHLGSVTVTLSATEKNGTVSATYYSLDGGPYKGYAAPFPISSDGTHQLMFYSVDTASNQETPHGQTIKIDATPPVSHVSALPVTQQSPSFTIQWSGTDASSGVRDFTIYVSNNGGPFTSWLVQTTATQATFQGAVGQKYGFYSIARDVAGNQEAPKTNAEASTTVAQPPLPISHVSALPATEANANFIVQWSGTDAGGPGIQSFSVYISDNGGAFAPWQSSTTATQAWLGGRAGHTYGFYSIARDNAGNQEKPKSSAEATTTVAAIVPGDVNGDGQVNCSDITLVKAAFGKKTGQPGFDARADVNHDGVVDVRDLAAVTQKLIPGTRCQ